MLFRTYEDRTLFMWFDVLFLLINRRKGVIIGNDQDGDDSVIVAHVSISFLTKKIAQPSVYLFGYSFLSSLLKGLVSYYQLLRGEKGFKTCVSLALLQLLNVSIFPVTPSITSLLSLSNCVK